MFAVNSSGQDLFYSRLFGAFEEILQFTKWLNFRPMCKIGDGNRCPEREVPSPRSKRGEGVT